MATTAAARERTNLPSELTSFVGRRRDLTQVRVLMGESRLVTLTGMGGVGKTRLARKVAQATSRVFADGVWQVELADVDDPTLIVPTIASALGLPQQGGPWTVEALTKQVGSRHMLLLLDNCEHLVEVAASVADRLLRGCPGLHVLATSREVLGVRGEQPYTVEPLGLPSPGQVSAEALASNESVSLFLDRASQVSPTFVFDAGNAPAIAELCGRLDGVPLALELGAAWIRVLTPEALVRQLAEHAELLGKGPRTSPKRQQSLHALVDWSYQLCAGDERALWRRASVFAAGFELDALDSIAGPHDATSGLQLIDVLDRLVAKSILFVDRRTQSVRFRMPEMIRAYGLARLGDAGEEDAARRAHLDWCKQMAGTARREWVSRSQLRWFDRVRRELPNVRAALEFALSREDGGSDGVQLLDRLAPMWFALGFVTEGVHWLDQVDTGMLKPQTRVTALRVRAFLAAIQGDRTAVAQTLEEAWSLARVGGDEAEIAWLTYVSALAALAAGDTEARSLMQEAAQLFQEISDDDGLVLALGDRVIAEATSDDPSGTEEVAAAFMAVADRLGESWERSYVEWARAFAYWRAAMRDEAMGALQESLRLAEQFEDHLGLGQGQELAAWIVASRDDARLAAELLGSASAAFAAAGSSVGAFEYLAGPHEQLVADLQAKLGEVAFAAAYQRGLVGPRDPVILDARVSRRTRTSVPEDLSPLTPRETEIAELVADGLTNKEIAARLVISQRTVESHVENVFVKLGLTSRAQATAWVVGRRN